MTIARLLGEAEELDAGSVEFARHIDHASSGEFLGQLMRDTMEQQPGAYKSVRAAVQQRVSAVGGAGQAIGLFMLAADMATTEALVGDQLASEQRSELVALWTDLLAHAEE